MDITDFTIAIANDQPLEDGSYEATLEGIEKRDTRYGENRLMWRFRASEHNTEIVGWTSSSPSEKSKAFGWATTLNPAIQSQRSWGPNDVIGRTCVLVVEVFEGQDGRIKNKILKVKPSA
jgi:hypothetical protein